MVELVIATALTGLIISFLGTGIYQMLTITRYGNDRLTAMHELQNAAYWFNLDGQMATGADADEELVLITSDDSSITYSLSGSSLHRTFGGDDMIMARNITAVSFSLDNRLVTMFLTSAPEGRDNISESGTYKVYLRPTEEG